MALAHQRAITIIVADSRQLYAGFDIGTAKATPAERREVPHVGIDVADPSERWNAARWAAVAEQGILAAMEAGRLPIVVGGTGLYVQALFQPLFAEPPLDPVARAAVARELEALSVAELRERTLGLDPDRAHLGRTQLLRAIEVATLTGTPLSVWHRETARPARFTPSYMVVDRGPALSARIEARVDAMLEAGWVDEVRTLCDWVPAEAVAWNATGYRELRDVVTGRRGLEPVRQEVIIRTRQYAKRQRTWFRHQLPEAAVCRANLDEQGASEVAMEWMRQWEEES
jgi:tRNA dimethylallyltransferase